jgi:peptidoglycan/xylan/chitin deacetylase (PgdA/CDA1 family)
VISLDFELHWGVRDILQANGEYQANLLGARAAVPQLLALFRQFEISATWATVGFLFAKDRDELMDFAPVLRPRYARKRFDPYTEEIGRNEAEDPLHFGRSLLERIGETPRQEIGSHTFSHYYCLERGSDAASFRADLDSARRIAAATLGLELRSLVLPRNQFNPGFASAIRESGFVCYRGNQSGHCYAAADSEAGRSYPGRALRLADSFVPVCRDSAASWDEIRSGGGLCNIPASRFLRPWEPRFASAGWLRMRRILSGMRAAARSGRVYHLWWHPHNFGRHREQSMRFLTGILSEFRALRDRYGFQSLSMAQAAAMAEAAARSEHP